MSLVSKALGIEFYKIVALLFVFMMLLSGVFEMRSGKSDYAVKVGNLVISNEELDRDIAEDITRFEQLLGKNIELQDREGSRIRSGTLRRMTEEKLILNMAMDLGVKVPTGLIADMTRERGDFIKSDGSFNVEAFATTLRESGQSEQQYFKRAADKLVWLSFLEILYSSIIPTQSYISFLVDQDSEAKKVDLFYVSAPKVDTYVPENDLVSQYYEANSDKFFSREMRKIKYMILKPDLISVDEIVIDDKEVESVIAARLEAESKIDRGDLINYIFSTEKDALDFFESLHKNQALAEGSVSKTAKSINQLTGVEIAKLSDIFSLNFEMVSDSEFSRVFKTEYGWHVIKVNRRYRYNADDLRPTVVSHLRASKQTKAFERFVDAIGQDLNNGLSIEDVALRYDLLIKESLFFDVNGKPEKLISKIMIDSDILRDPSVLKRVFTMSPNAMAENLYVPGTRGYITFTVAGLKEKRKLSFNEVKEQIVADLVVQHKEREAKNMAMELRKQLLSDGKFKHASNIEVESGLAVSRLSLKRSLKISNIDYEDSARLFSEICAAGDNGVSNLIKIQDGRWVIAKVMGNIGAQNVDSIVKRSYGIKNFGSPIFSEIYSQTVNLLYGRYKVKYGPNVADLKIQ